MTASLYQSGSTNVLLGPCAIRLTFDAQNAARNQPFIVAHASPNLRSSNRNGHVAVAALTKSVRLILLSSDLHDVAGNTLPLTATLHPGVGETKRAIKWLTVLRCALFVSRADDDCHAWSVGVHRELFIHSRLVSVFIFFDLRNNGGLVHHSAIPINAGEIVGDERLSN